MGFFYAMLTTAMAASDIAAVRDVAPAINLPAGLLPGYLGSTALMTVRPPIAASRWLHPGLMVVALAIGITSLWFGFEAVANGGTRKGMPAFPFLMFGVVGLLAGIGDVRLMRSGALRGVRRLARHLWRMSFALFIAALSFFIGQAQVFPKPVRIMPMLALPVLTVLVTMVYWLWRVRVRRNVQGIVAVSAPEAA